MTPLEFTAPRPTTPSAVRLRILRALEVLERIGTTEARKVLRTLAGGATGAHQTRAAKTALERLSRREAAAP